MTTDAELKAAIAAAMNKFHRNSCHPTATERELWTGADAVLAVVRAAGRLAPEVAGSVVDTAYDPAMAAFEANDGWNKTSLRAALEAAAPIITAATDAKHRDILEGILVDVDFAIADHTDGSETLKTCRTRLGIIRDYVLAAIRTGSAS